MPNIKSSTDLRNNYNAISTFCHENREPIFITRNGQGDLAVMSIEVYEDIVKNLGASIQNSREGLYHSFAVGKTDVLTGYVRPAKEAAVDNDEDILDGVMPWDPSVHKLTLAETFGCMRGQFKMSDDFDEPLEDFKEYM